VKDCIEIIKVNAINFPKRIAVIDGEKKITYEDFLSLVNHFSNQLIANRSKPKVIIDLKQGTEAYALIIATLNVGGTYCPLNIAAPVDRKLEIINEFDPDFIITEKASDKENLNSERVLTISELLASKATEKETSTLYDPESIIYVIYTSGSTGLPKGVQICRKALNKFLDWSIPTYGANENDIWGQFSLLSFDLSIVDIFTCLCSGATLLAMPDETSKLVPTSAIQKHKITIWHSVPSAVDFMIKRQKTKVIEITSLRVMTFCGEPLRKHHLDFLFNEKPEMIIYNTYGPTEGTLFCSWQKFEKNNYERFCNPTLSIGTPIPGWEFELKPVEDDDEVFEIIIYGNYIGKGYLSNISDSKFFTKKIGDSEISTFHTGDLVAKRDGNLYFSSRVDRQIKLNGHRIEPDEIDSKIREYIDKTSVTIPHDGFLYSFIESNEDFDKEGLKDFLINKIEPYKIPREFIRIDKLPRSSNAKINYSELQNHLNNECKE